ncbi:MAG: Gfo/Idh/MocA family oxidoreductase [Gammaproteobacteria bacterium]
MAHQPMSFCVIGADHIHIYKMTEDLLAAGGKLKGWWTRDNPETNAGTIDPFPGIPRSADRRSLLQDPDIDLVLIGAVPSERAGLAIEAMLAGKDVVTDKPGATTLQDLETLRTTAAATGRIWSVSFSERYRIRAAIRAAEIVESGFIGEVVQTVGLGPHRGLFGRRPPWFFRRATGGGILTDIGSHQIDSFIFFTGSRQPQIVAASVGNFTRPHDPEFEDFGEVMLRGERASGYARVDWLTPDAQPYASDGRLMILGTLGTIEIRKYVDLAGRPGADHLIVVHSGECERIDCSSVPFRYFSDISKDVRERTSTAEKPGHSFLVTELSIRAQSAAEKLGHLAR